VGRGAPVIVESRDGLSSGDRQGAQGATRYQAGAAVPLGVGSRVGAVVQGGFARSRPFSTDDRNYLFVLGPRAAQALDRTWQYESAQRARAEAETMRARAD